MSDATDQILHKLGFDDEMSGALKFGFVSDEMSGCSSSAKIAPKFEFVGRKPSDGILEEQPQRGVESNLEPSIQNQSDQEMIDQQSWGEDWGENWDESDDSNMKEMMRLTDQVFEEADHVVMPVHTDAMQAMQIDTV